MDSFLESAQYADIVADAAFQQWRDTLGGLLLMAMFVAGLLLSAKSR